MRDEHRMADKHEVRLDHVQVLWLTLGAVVALGLMFGFGVVVGRRAERLASPPVVEQATTAIEQLDEEGDVHEALTFYTQLTAPEPRDIRAVKPNAPVASLEARPASVPAVAASSAPAPKPVVDSAAKPAVEAVQQPVVAAPVTESTSEMAATAVKADNDSADAVGQGLAMGRSSHGNYTVQVSSFPSEEEANAFAAAMRRKGFKPFVVAAALPGKGTWYRVRVGSFADGEQAKSAKQLLARADIAGWVVKSE